MKSETKSIYKTYNSYLPTLLPVNYFGSADGKVFVIYSRFYEINLNKSGVEYVFALHKEFFYDYKYEKLILMEKGEKLFPVLAEMVDKPEPKIKILKVYRKLRSYNEAQYLLNSISSNLTSLC